MKRNYVCGNYFFGNKISDYGIEMGYVDYRTLAKAFDCVMNNSIMENTMEIGYWDNIQCGEWFEDEEGNEYTYDEAQEKIEALQEEKEALEDEEGKEEEIEAIEANIEALEDSHYPECFQYYIISDGGADIIQEYTNDPLWYNETLDMWVWGITHYGTSWDYVLTDIKCNVGYDYKPEEEEEE